MIVGSKADAKNEHMDASEARIGREGRSKADLVKGGQDDICELSKFRWSRNAMR